LAQALAQAADVGSPRESPFRPASRPRLVRPTADAHRAGPTPTTRVVLAVAALASVCPPARAVEGPWLSALGASENFEVVSLASHFDLGLLNRSNLLTEFPLKVRILGPERAELAALWRNVYKLELLHGHVSQLPPEKVVIVLDLFDVVWLGCRRDLIEAFHRFGRPLVFSAEFVPYPLSNSNASLQRVLGAGYPYLPGAHRFSTASAPLPFVRRRLGPRRVLHAWRDYRFLNAGCLAGYAGALKVALGRMLANGFANDYVLGTPLATTDDERLHLLVGHDDQIAWHAYALRHADEVALDYDAELFLSVLGLGYQDFELHGAKREVWARPFGREVCFAHGNGASNVAIHLRVAQSLGVQPEKCRDEVELSEGRQLHYLDCSG